jgi:hypothetical protein
MKIKYTSWYESIHIRLPELKFDAPFRRNVWVDVHELVAKELLKSPMFLCEADLIFDKNIFQTPKHFGINRFGALGDLIQLLPIIRYMRRTMGHKFTLGTQAQYVPIFKDFDIFEDVIPDGRMDKRFYDRVFYLDGVLENDHSLTDPSRLKHRVHLYEEFFGIKCDHYDFSFPKGKEDAIAEYLKM